MANVYYGNNKVTTGKYSNKDGKVITYFDRSLIDPNAKQRREEYEAKRQQDKAKFEHILQVTEMDSDNGRN